MHPLFVGPVLFWHKRYVRNYVFACCACGWGWVLFRNYLLAGKVCFCVFVFPENKPVDTALGFRVGREPKHSLCMGWRNFFPVVLLCQFLVLVVNRFWFYLLCTYVLRVQYSCGVVLVFWFWREIVFSVMYLLSVQYSCAVVSVFWLWREIVL